MCHGNKFSKETKAKLKQVCETFVDTEDYWWDLKRRGEKSGSCCAIL